MSKATDISVDWRDLTERLLTETPVWGLAAAGGAVLLVVVLLGFWASSRASKRREARDEQHREAVKLARQEKLPIPPEPLHMDPKPLLGGIAVSLYGLWGFATETARLPFFFAIGFLSMFDILQLRLFSQMYKLADKAPQRRWTRQLRVLQATAWAFVTLSAVANFQHAPNLWSAPWLAIMPIGAAWVIQVELKNALEAGDAAEEEQKKPEGTKPGPVKLITLLWRRIWAWCFRLFGMDVNDRADDMVRRALARDAADASYALRNVLKEKQELEELVARAGAPQEEGVRPVSRTELQKAQKRLVVLNKDLEKKVRPRAQSALEMAETQDSEQGLQLMQRMAWLTRADDVAMLDYGPDSPAMTVLGELNIAENAEFVKSRKRAKEADEKAAEAERVRLGAEAAVKEAAEKLAAVEKALEDTRKEVAESQQRAAAEQETEEKRLKALREERTLLESSDATAAQLYQRTAEELDTLKGQMIGLQEERGRLADNYDQVQKQAKEAAEQVLRLEGEQQTLKIRLENLQTERTRFETEAANARREADEARSETEEARREMVRLQGQLTALEKVQQAVPARSQHGGTRIDARIGVGGGDTRQRIRDLLGEMSPEERQESQREIARRLKDRVGLGEDAIRNHLRAIAQEEADAADVPGPRTEEGHTERDERDFGDLGDVQAHPQPDSPGSVHRPDFAESADR
ncbi:hypothetical protein [Streptomyces sp. NPDC059513]|uniref:hypothetical protein n=1 Tax=unclassified Streptomyces TaxID=2593676 RepID=UPI0036C83E49